MAMRIFGCPLVDSKKIQVVNETSVLSKKKKKRGILFVEHEVIDLFAEIIKKKYKAYEICVRIEEIVIAEIFKEGINLT